MTLPDDFYRASEAELPPSDRVAAPLLVKVAVGFYIASLLMRYVRGIGAGAMPDAVSLTVGMAAAAIVAGVSIALLYRMRWARIWIIVLTILPVINAAAGVAWMPWGPARIFAHCADGARIVAGAIMFMPSVRAWFAMRSR
jgi:hypothetical protein